MRLLFFVVSTFLFLFKGEVFGKSNIEIEEYPLSSDNARIARHPEEVVVIQLKSDTDLQKLKKYQYLGNRWISMRWKDMQEQNVLSDLPVVRYGKLKPDSKLSRVFRQDFDIEKSYVSHEQILIQLHTWGTKEETESLLKQYQIHSVDWDRSGRVCTIHADDRLIALLSESDIISYIEPLSEERTPLLNAARGLMNVANVHLPEPTGLGLQGNGIKIGVWDYGLTGFHKDIENQFINVEKSFYNAGGTQHTTLVTGAIASKGVLRQDYIGMAPGAKVFVYNYFGKVIDEILSAKNNYGVFLTNHSYNLGSAFRCFTEYSYSTASQQIDRFALEEPQIVNIFAAGNSSAACAYDYRTIVPGFQYAKNVILVGNIQNNETFYPGSAKGPTTDGRLGPLVVAKGSGSFTPTTGIILQTPADSYTHAYGTSFAAPVVAGMVGLMQEAYLKSYGVMPNNSTVKAILCNTAKDLGTSGPDYDYGFGKADAYQAIASIQNGDFIEGAVNHLESKSYALEVPEGVRELKLLITWNDLAASLPNNKVLVNDIDLQLVAPDGRIYLPLILNPDSPSLPSVEGRDSLNNIEQIVVRNPMAGNYTIRVIGHDIIGEQQDFSVTYWMNENEFNWNYPVKNEMLPSSTANILRWHSNTEADSIQIQYSANEGASWTNLTTRSSEFNHFSWTTPSGNLPKVLLRAMTMDGRLLNVSDTFSISPRNTISSNVICYDHIRIVWGTVSGATKYIVSMLNDQNEWISVAETTQNNYVLSKTVEGKEYFFAVTPVFGTFVGLRSNALKIRARNAGACSFAYKDVAVSSIAPVSGAIDSEYSLKENEKLTLRVINYANSVVNNVMLYYQVDTHAVREILIGNMVANALIEHVSDEVYDFSAIGEYIVRAWVTSSNDVNVLNDTLEHVISQKASVIAEFPYLQDFEGISDTFLYNNVHIGLKEIPEWDYLKDGAGRIYNFGSESFSPGGSRALTVDAYTDNTSSVNKMYLNIDLLRQKDSLVYLDYKLIRRGEQNGDDSIYIQGNKNEPWLPVESIFNSTIAPGVTQYVKRVNLSEVLRRNGQQFSEHSVLKFQIQTERTALTISTNGGYSIDDIQLYNGGIDLAVESILLKPVYCIYQNTLPLNIPIRVRIKNNSPNQIPVGEAILHVKINDTLKITELNNVVFQPYQTIDYEFSEMLSFDNYENFMISVLLEHPNDKIVENNTIYNHPVGFLKAITNLPLETSFDKTDELKLVPAGNFYSWELGKPSKIYLNDVADNPGQAWVTDLKNYYPSNELSYLNIGCLNPALLTFNSELSFLMLYNIEFGGDGLWVEYSYDSDTWFRLGTSASGYNWYNPENIYNIWDGNRLTWQTASMPLSALVYSGQEQVFFRFGFSSGDYIQLEGVAIDNLRINNQLNARINTQSLTATGVSSGNGQVELKSNDVIYGYINDNGQVLGNVELDIIVPDGLIPAYRDKFLLPRYYHIKTAQAPQKDYALTLFNKNAEYMSYLNTDKNARRMGDIGYLVYDGLNTDTLYSNNHFDENYTFYHPDSIEFWPYLDGYELRFSLDKQNAEIYLTGNGRSIAAYPPFVAISDLQVYRREESNYTFVEWAVEKEQTVQNYVIQHSTDGINFADAGTVDAHSDGDTNYLFIDSVNILSGQHYYRIVANNNIGEQYTSLIDSVSFEFVPVNISVKTEMSFGVNYVGNGHIQMYWNKETAQKSLLRIVDVSGKIVEEWREVLATGYNKLHSDNLKKSPSGMYFLQVIDGNDSKSRKFVKSE